MDMNSTGDARVLTSPQRNNMPGRFEVRDKPVSLYGTLREGERFRLMVVTHEDAGQVDAKPVDCPLISEPMFTLSVQTPGKYMVIPEDWPSCKAHYASVIRFREEGIQWIR
jgi:hypothetical protein